MKGYVFDQDGNPLAGVVITNLNTDNVTNSIKDGYFELEANAGDLLDFQHNYGNEQVRYNKEDILNAYLEPAPLSIEVPEENNLSEVPKETCKKGKFVLPFIVGLFIGLLLQEQPKKVKI